MGKKGRRRKITRYWHGGAPGLNVGDDLVPATALDYLPVLYADPDYGSDSAYVYVSTSQTLAMGCAAQWGSHFGDRVAGDLYQVEPKGALEVDPDYAHVPDLSWRCQRATIVAVYRRPVEMTHELSIYGLQFTTWDDGQPMYDQAGFLLPISGCARLASPRRTSARSARALRGSRPTSLRNASPRSAAAWTRQLWHPPRTEVWALPARHPARSTATPTSSTQVAVRCADLACREVARTSAPDENWGAP